MCVFAVIDELNCDIVKNKLKSNKFTNRIFRPMVRSFELSVLTTPNCNLVCIHTYFKTDCFTLLWHRLWVLTGHSLIIRDVQLKSTYIKYIWWYGCQSWECIQALLELPKGGMGTILDPEYLHTYHSLYFYTYTYIYITNSLFLSLLAIVSPKLFSFDIYIYIYIYIMYIYIQRERERVTSTQILRV